MHGYQRFDCEYGFDGSRWGFHIYAKDWDEARARIKAMGMGQVLGTHVATVKVPAGSLIRRGWNWLRGTSS